MLKLRPHQEKVRHEVFDEIRGGHQNIVLVASCGFGKTEVSCALAQDASSKGRQVFFMVHRDNLVRQTVARFQKYNLNPGVIKSGFKPDLSRPVQVCSIQSLARRRDVINHIRDTRALLLWDESHITAFSALGRQMIESRNLNHIHIALTATPWRLKRTESFGDLFTALVTAPLPSELIQMGFLVPLRYFGLPYIDTSSVGTRGGDFAQDQLSLVTADPAVVRDAVENWKRLGDNRRTIAFTVDVAHSLTLADEFSRQGIPAAAVHGEMDPVKEREPIYQALAHDEIKVVVSCEALAEGFDCPSVGTILLCRPTKSRAKYLQQIGRGMRIADQKSDCIVLDQAGNVERHGFVEDLTKSDFELHPSSEPGSGQAPVKQCPACGALIHISKMVCPVCGFIFPEPEKEKASGNLVELIRGNPSPKKWSIPATIYREFRADAYKKKISPGYAAIKYSEWRKEQLGQGHQYQEHPSAGSWSLGAVFGDTPSDRNRSAYLNYLKKIDMRSEKGSSWVQREYDREFGEGAYRVFIGSLAPMV